MTRYLCTDPTHRRGDDPRTVDVSSQVRLERALVPRTPVVLAYTEALIDVAGKIDDLWSADERAWRLRRSLVGDGGSGDLPVVLVSELAVSRPPGRYELDELRDAEPVVDRLVVAPGGAGDDVVVVSDRDEVAPDPSGSDGSFRGRSVTTQAHRRTRVVPQGIFDVSALTARLLQAGREEPAIVDAIRATPTIQPESQDRAAEAWRVVITCPEPEGSPPVSHRTVFTGTGRTEPAVVIGTPADGFELALERSAEVDLVPSSATATLERRVMVLLAGELAVVTSVLFFAWLAGALGFAVRESPGWVGLAAALALGGVAFVTIPLFAAQRADGNQDDTLTLRRYYASRLELLTIAPAVSVGLVTLAMLVGWLGPALAAEPPVPVASVSFEGSAVASARVAITARDVATDERVHAEVRVFEPGDQVGEVVGRVTVGGTPSGDVVVIETVAVSPMSRHLSVVTWTADRDDPSLEPPVLCTPAVAGAGGCTVVAVASAS